MKLWRYCMQITYSLEAKDIKESQNYYLRNNSRVKKTRFFTYLLIFAISYWQLLYLFIFTDFLSNFNWSVLSTYFTTGTFAFLVGLIAARSVDYFWQLYSINSTVKKYKHGDGVLGEHLIKFEEDYLVEITDVNQTKQSWKGVDKIEENQNYIFIFISPLNAHIIPKRFFDTEQDASMFFEEAKRLKETAISNFSPSYLASNDQIK